MTTTAKKRPTPQKPGAVCLVGAGPGDPDLLTVRAVELLAKADVVFADTTRLAAVLARTDSEVIDTSLIEDDAEVAKQVLTQAKAGRHVVRLFQGDPSVGAGGPALALALAKAKLGFELVAGVSTVTGVPSYAGVPLTDATHHSFTTVDLANADPDWSAL